MTSSTPLPGNSLADKADAVLLSQWHPEKNGRTTPRDVTAGSGKKAWWTCDQGHTWEAAISSRVKGSGCPYCRGFYPVVGVNDLATVNPHVAAQWHPTKNNGKTPENVTAGSNKKAWWQCQHNHEWEAVIASRAKGAGCPYCSGHKVTPGINDLATLNPSKAAQWDQERNGELTPAMVGVSSHQKVWWKGCTADDNHRWLTSIYSQVSSRASGCAVCAGRQTNANMWVEPTIADTPKDSPVDAFADDKELIIIDTVDISMDTALPDVSPVEENEETIQEVANTLANYATEDLLAQWHPTRNRSLTPDDVTPVSGRSVWWLCPLGHEWNSKISNRFNGSGCPVCSNNKILAGFNDLATTHPHLAQEWHPEKNDRLPSTLQAGSTGVYWWQCFKGHEWESRLSGRVYAQSRCPYCTERIAIKGTNDISTTHPVIAQEWSSRNNVPIDEVIAHSSYKAWWVCSLGHTWKSSVRGRMLGGVTCKTCSGRTILKKFNDLSTTHAQLVLEWSSKNVLTPEEVTYKSTKTVTWRCSKSHEWDARIWDRTRKSGATGCPQCAFKSTSSQAEKELAKWLTSLNLIIETNNRSLLSPYELDIYLPEHKFAIEYNGLYWHSEAKGKNSTYHLNKMKACQDAQVTLFQVWEDDWRDKQEIVKRMILHRLGLSTQVKVYARQTKVVSTDIETAREFLEENHIQGYAFSGNYFGLIDRNEELVALMLMRRMSNGDVYLDRYATNKVVVGGFTKLLKHAIAVMNPRRVITFADQSISQGNLYEKNNFTVDKVLNPDYMYLVKGRREHKFNYRKSRFARDPNLYFDSSMTEAELAKVNKLHRIWDSGKIRYVYTPPR